MAEKTRGQDRLGVRARVKPGGDELHEPPAPHGAGPDIRPAQVDADDGATLTPHDGPPSGGRKASR